MRRYLSPVCAPKTVPLTPNVPERRPLPGRAALLSAFEKTVCRTMIPNLANFPDETAIRTHFMYSNLASRSPGLFTGRPDHVVYMRRLAKVAEKAAVRMFRQRHRMTPMTQLLKDKVAAAMRSKIAQKIASLLVPDSSDTSPDLQEGYKADREFTRCAQALRRALEAAEYYLDNEESAEITTACHEALNALCAYRELVHLGESDARAAED